MTNSVGVGASLGCEHLIRLDFFASFFIKWHIPTVRRAKK